jgi:YNFM family putative membrane transporter
LTPPADPGRSGQTLRPGTPAYTRMLGCVFLAGFAVFLVMYDTQGLLPQIGTELGAGESVTSWTVAATTLGMAAGMIPLSQLGLSRGLYPRMLTFLIVSALVGVLCAVMPSIQLLILARFVQGVCVSLVPSSALALIGQRVVPSAITSATGVYLAGNTVGGLFSRLGPGAVAQFASWRWAMAAMAGVCLVCAVGVFALRPPRPTGPAAPAGSPQVSRSPIPALRRSLSVPGIVYACIIGAALMAAFNSAYTVVGYRLQGPTLGLGPGAANLVFLLYLLGTFTSARAGSIVGRIGLVPAILASAIAVAAGYWIAAPDMLLPMALGLGVLTAMFFVGHSSASSTVSTLAPASARSTASSTYLTCYYIGATVGSALGAVGFEHMGWVATAGLGTLYAVIAAVAAILGRKALTQVTPTR